MSVIKTLIAATAASAFAASAALAGGFADEIVEEPVAPVVMVEPPAPAGSIPGWVIPAALAAALIALAVSGDDSEEDDGGDE